MCVYCYHVECHEVGVRLHDEVCIEPHEYVRVEVIELREWVTQRVEVVAEATHHVVDVHGDIESSRAEEILMQRIL
jgi:hypothetical protein